MRNQSEKPEKREDKNHSMGSSIQLLLSYFWLPFMSPDKQIIVVEVHCNQILPQAYKPLFLSHVADWSSHQTKDGDEKSLSTQSRLSVWCMTLLNHLDTNQSIVISYCP